MKKTLKNNLLIWIVLLSIPFANAQNSPSPSQDDVETDVPKNELSLNALILILGVFEANYEYLLNEESGVGVSALYTFDEDLWDINHQITGYYRFYFGKKYAAGFYGEAFMMYNSNVSYDYRIENGNYFYEEKDRANLAVGFGFGTKLVARKNLFLDAGLGLGRNLFENNFNDNIVIVPRFRISFGYRF